MSWLSVCHANDPELIYGRLAVPEGLKVGTPLTWAQPLDLVVVEHEDQKLVAFEASDVFMTDTDQLTNLPGFTLSPAAIKHRGRIVPCSSCRSPMIWFKTERGKRIPIDGETVKLDDDVYDRLRHRTHFATCPEADKHRRAKS